MKEKMMERRKEGTKEGDERQKGSKMKEIGDT